MSGPIVNITIVGDTKVEARLDRFPQQLRASVVNAMNELGVRLLAYDRSNLSGGVLQKRTGALYDAQALTVTDQGDSIVAEVGFNSSQVPYGAVLEFGVDHDWLITAKNAKALKFELGGTTKFAKSVTHPAMPARSFLRRALEMVTPEISPVLTQAIQDGI